MKKEVIVIGMLLLVLVTLTSGCIGILDGGKVSNEEEAIESISDVSGDLDTLATDLDEINDELG